MEVGILFRKVVRRHLFVALQRRDRAAENVERHCAFDKKSEKLQRQSAELTSSSHGRYTYVSIAGCPSTD